MQNLNFIMSQFPNQSRWKEYPRENNTRTTKVWENVVQTRLGGEFWACDVITHKTYFVTWSGAIGLVHRCWKVGKDFNVHALSSFIANCFFVVVFFNFRSSWYWKNRIREGSWPSAREICVGVQLWRDFRLSGTSMSQKMSFHSWVFGNASLYAL